MCVNYKPPTRLEIANFIRSRMDDPAEWPIETWQDYAAPIIRSGETPDAEPELVVGTFGMIPKRFLPPGKKSITTMNARAETIGQKPAFAKAWRLGQTCLLPAHHFYEQNYESGKAERWAIGMDDGQPFCVAGLWRSWEEPERGVSFAFTQITINADEHPLMRRFHKPGDEKRSLVIVPRSEYADWLSCNNPELARSMLLPFPAARMKAWAAAR
ncbi:SOS response-associated peptidase family protein [Herbaspirillum autotrophicum]|uniref:SOS response-associated peptidase family protein n=1 Tax=Herbaspirillum autotrophicum TaxID=180195 RepID=UPI00067E33DD|nr:SOS response-associated peptidase family protein [Herbaspirillum autotrophicum]